MKGAWLYTPWAAPCDGPTHPSLGPHGSSIDSAPVYLTPASVPRMRFLKRLTNPFALVAEGFVAGAILFAASSPSTIEFRQVPPPQPVDPSVIPNASR